MKAGILASSFFSTRKTENDGDATRTLQKVFSRMTHSG